MAFEDTFQIPCNAPAIGQQLDMAESKGVVVDVTTGGVVNDVTLPLGTSWFSIAITEGAVVKEDPILTDNGPAMQFTLQAVVPKIDAQRYNFNDYVNRRWIFRYKDANGNVRLVGNAQHPARFTYSDVVDDANNAYNIVLTCVSETKQPFYSAAAVASAGGFTPIIDDDNYLSWE